MTKLLRYPKGPRGDEGERQRLCDEADRLSAKARELRNARPDPEGTVRQP